VALVRAAREGLGSKAELMVDAGWAYGRDVDTVLDRARRFAPYQVTWLEEPLFPDAIPEYGELARRNPPVPIAAGENAATLRAAENYIEQGGLSFIQIDAGRIGGITVSRKVVEKAAAKGIIYVNHTFKSRLSVASALHAFADLERFKYLEYPSSGSPLAEGLAAGTCDRGPDGLVSLTEAPGLGVKINLECVRKYLAPVRIDISGKTIFSTIEL
jgi:L-alanine-DL-glutamate epimerase-like enolase superfamily enzyme